MRAAPVIPSIGGNRVDPPVVLAPMAGITNRAFRRLCRESGAALYVSEMVTSRALLERNAETLDLIAFDRDETPRSVQLYGVDPRIVGAAVAMIVAEDLADHVDLNFGCPVPKVTRKGGGAALPWKLDLFRAVVAAAVGAARGRVPVTVKMRMGIDSDHITYLRAGRAAAREGVAWVALHARTAEQMYSGQADWLAIRRLVEELRPLGVPVLGNGDIWSADDGLRMVTETGCAGVVVGRGCLGRPWLFAELAAAFAGRPVPNPPDCGKVLATMRRHAELLVEMRADELAGCRDIRKHVAWYLKGFRVPQPTRAALGTVATLSELDRLLAGIDPHQEFPQAIALGPRGRTSAQRRVALPEGWLDTCELDERLDLSAAEIGVGGG
jgi:nifR3 family TIM-barrel protein